MVDAALNLAAIGFELGFAGTAGADAAAQLRHCLALAGEPRQHVLKLRQLDLQLAFAGARVAGKDVQNELRPVENPAGKLGLEVAQLGRRQVVVEEHQVGLGRGDDPGNLLDFARADQRGRIGMGTALQDLGNDYRAGARDQFAKLGQRFVSVQLRGGTRR